jgi:drug/metabolite transporter (DMT)-like permease
LQVAGARRLLSLGSRHSIARGGLPPAAPGETGGHVLGALLALISAATFAYNNVATRRGVLHGSVFQAMAITVPMGVVLFGAAAWLAGSLGRVAQFSWHAIACFAMAGFMHFVFGRYCNYRALAAIGTNLAAPIQQWEVLVTLALALIFLGETLGPIKFLGIALLLLGPALANLKDADRKPLATDPPAFVPRYAEGYLFAFLTIFGYGSSPIFIKAGLQSGGQIGGMGDSLAGGVVSYAFATVLIIGATFALGQVSHVRQTEARPARWFALAGVLVFLSHMFRYMALAIVPVTIVAPILRMQTLFRFYFSWLLTRDHEVFESNVILGTVVSLAGAILLSLNTDFVLAVLPLPEIARSAARWTWP